MVDRSTPFTNSPTHNMPERDTLSSNSTNSLRAQLRLMNRCIDEVQKEFVKSKDELEESSMIVSPFVPEIHDKPISRKYWLPTLEAYDDSFDPTEHVVAFRVQMDSISLLGITTLLVTVKEEPRSKTLIVLFMMVKLPSTYNAILNLPTLNKLRVIVSTYHRMMKFLTSARVGEARSDP
ncbi:hypothetical protein B296_00021041 [Ensete ventricosum]|uniref:Reverse transcriptase domain-containing protein n=1 Tax=Ensete ventricosum TaxID=4639 RepID=A0A426Z358_ENSVE|nr:hypothetical protein B296_00021041 [Ensete ventricosum]